MRLRRFLCASRRLPWVYVLLALVLCAPAAHATTYYFSISASDLLTNLKAATPSTYQNDAGYYAIFFQPASGFSLTAANTTWSSPKPAGTGVTDDWQGTLATTNPFGSGSIIEFARDGSQSYATVLANTGSQTLINKYGTSIPKTTTGLVPWGNASTIDSYAFPNAFSFTISGMDPNLANKPVSFTVDAAYLSYCNLSFHTLTTTFDMTAQTPEPGTILLFGLGLASVLAGVIRKRAKTTPAA